VKDRLLITKYTSVLIFIGLFFIFQYSFQMSRDTVIERIAIDVITVKPSTWFINILNAPIQVISKAHQIISPDITLSVLNGCEGLDGIFLVLAAMVAVKIPLKYKIIGMLTSTILMYLLNQARIVILFFTLQYDRELFYLFHSTIAPMVIVLVSVTMFLFYINFVNKRHSFYVK